MTTRSRSGAHGNAAAPESHDANGLSADITSAGGPRSLLGAGKADEQDDASPIAAAAIGDIDKHGTESQSTDANPGPGGSPSVSSADIDIDWHGEATAIAARHWRRTLWLVAVLMVIGFVVTFVPQFWAREWVTMRFAGWPLPFYMGAQGSILIDIGLIIVYALMQRLNDARYRDALHRLREARRDSLGLPDDTLERAMAPATSRSAGSASTRAASAQTYR
ncbi:hypothetical protein PAQ31011_02132 [Pandoraea aquatica]|uniref:Sodium symporter small subunit domain-containing protein n=1 Tax=Pandoraea aquatica TaxID=2508290 RepID=A0A5E4ULN3_9BURK|nr:DUF4212 domain-containing protein [Pandoraea aquatica]VVE00826.1 hypothetical protein PAQ31011_02132 [Pandoraea aquatica]